MIVDLDFHRRQKQAQKRSAVSPQVSVIFDVVENEKDTFGLHPDAIIYTDSDGLADMMNSHKKHQIKFCNMMRDYFSHFGKELESGNKNIQFVMNFYEE